MLDSETKQNIDNLRDILVGKIPNPQSQVEQITTGLIYKFMNDMDQEAIDLGGEKSFFIGDYEKYSWDKLFDSKISGEEKVKLYSEAVEKIYLNASAPKLFREIFKNAFLPFKDEATLNMFLKEINKFSYSHSEKLGDAFEYLLSFMGAQGDAGQFRTPRHIIDFIVNIIDPKKNHSILDPACGTAGFLISSFKHILKTNTVKRLGDQLSVDDKKEIGVNLRGYDISPEMIRLSLVNMYLNGFSTPRIEEYDTLSKDANWNEYFDIILANPPFFSPKGGIQPHNRFSVNSKKAEVLFTSYILEHLKPDGRAGIIVPEGIIFQSQNAYRNLRRQLVESSLIGIISLPAGVFNPYSGVKTSILILNKKISQEIDHVFFASVNNDGFNLGVQRTPITDNDLPNVLTEIKNFLNKKDSNLFLVKKESILDNKNCDFQKSKYEEEIEEISEFETLKLSEIADIEYGTRIVKKTSEGDKYPVYGGGGETFRTNEFNRENQLIVSRFAMSENCVRFVKGKFFLNDSGLSISKINPLCLRSYLDNLLISMQSDIYKLGRGVGQKNLHIDSFKNIKIPLPPIDYQKKIISQITSYREIINSAKNIIHNHTFSIDIEPSWQVNQLDEVCNIVGGGTPSRQENRYWEGGNIKWLSCKHLDDDGNVISNEKITEEGLQHSSSTLIKKNSVIVVNRVSLGKVVYLEEDYAINQDLTGVWSKDKNILDPYFLFLFLYTIRNRFVNAGQGLGVKGITREFIKNQKISLPPIKIQKELVMRADLERNLINGNNKLIEIYNQKIDLIIQRIRGNNCS